MKYLSLFLIVTILVSFINLSFLEQKQVKLISSLDGFTLIDSLTYIDDNNSLAFISNDFLVFKDIVSSEVIKKIQLNENSIKSICYNGDDTIVLSEKQEVRLIKISTGEQIKIINSQYLVKEVICIGNKKIILGSDKVITIYNIENRQLLQTINTNLNYTPIIYLDNDLIGFSNSKSLMIYNITTGKISNNFTYSYDVWSYKYIQNNKIAVQVGNEIYITNFKLNKHSLLAKKDNISSIGFIKDNQLAFSYSELYKDDYKIDIKYRKYNKNT